jgi:hypothetical protein
LSKGAARVATYRERMRSEGFRCIEVWTHSEDADLIRAFANELREQRSKLNGEDDETGNDNASEES